MVDSILAQHNAVRNESPSKKAAIQNPKPVLSEAEVSNIQNRRLAPWLISYTTAALVFLLAMGAFALSYNALQGVAADNGITGRQAYIWPLLIDFALIVFSLAVVRNHLRGERTLWPWSLVGLYTVTTVVFNVLHAPDNLTARIVAIVAPMSLFLSFETLMGMLKSEVNRAAVVAGIATLSDRHNRVRAELDTLVARADTQRITLTAEIESLTARRNDLRSELGDLRKERRQAQKTADDLPRIPVLKQSRDEKAILLKKANQVKFASIEARRERVKELAGQGLPQPAIAEALDMSISTIKRDLVALRSQIILALLQEGLDEQAIATRLELNLETVQADIANLNGRVKEVA